MNYVNWGPKNAQKLWTTLIGGQKTPYGLIQKLLELHLNKLEHPQFHSTLDYKSIARTVPKLKFVKEKTFYKVRK